MHRFHLVDEAAVILQSKGVYRQVKVFRRENGLYAAHGSGFVRLYENHGTSHPTLRWDDIELPGNVSYTAGQFGKLEIIP